MSTENKGMTLENIKYTHTFTEDEHTLLVQCLQADMMKIHREFYARHPNVTDCENPTPMHTALMVRMMDERTKTIIKVREQHP